MEYTPQLLHIVGGVVKYIPQFFENIAGVVEYIPQLLHFFGTRPSKSCWTHNTYFYYKFQCSYNKLLNNNCTFDNDNNTVIYNKIKNGIIGACKFICRHLQIMDKK